MPEPAAEASTNIVRVTTPGMPAFQLRKGEEGISVFDPAAAEPPLTEEEIVGSFRSGSQPVVRSVKDVEAHGLQVVAVEGAETLSDRLRQAHREIRPGPGMTRDQFKRALKELE
jgi:hypothetical protein